MTDDEQQNLLVSMLRWLHDREKLTLCTYEEGRKEGEYLPAGFAYKQLARDFLKEREEFERTYQTLLMEDNT